MCELPAFVRDGQKISLGRMAGVVQDGINPAMGGNRKVDHCLQVIGVLSNPTMSVSAQFCRQHLTAFGRRHKYQSVPARVHLSGDGAADSATTSGNETYLLLCHDLILRH